MRRDIIAATVVLAVAVFAMLAILFSGTEAYGQHPAVCRVRHSNGGGTASMGSGTLVCTEGKGVVLTAWHVLDSGVGVPPTCEFYNLDGQRLTVQSESIRRGPGDSAAIVIALDKVRNIEPMRIYPYEVKPGMTVYAEGYGGGRMGRRKGRVTRYFQDQLEVSLPSISGDSGGTVFVVDDKQIPYMLGIVSASDFSSMTVGCANRPVIAWLGRLGVAVARTGRVACQPLGRVLGGRNWQAPYRQQQPNT